MTQVILKRKWATWHDNLYICHGTHEQTNLRQLILSDNSSVGNWRYAINLWKLWYELATESGICSFWTCQYKLKISQNCEESRNKVLSKTYFRKWWKVKILGCTTPADIPWLSLKEKILKWPQFSSIA